MGAFKFRGAYNAVVSLSPDELTRGVCAVSSGNHAQAVSLSARLCGTRAVILMPADAPALKRAATEGYGAEVVEYERYGEDREELVHELAAERGMVLVHPFDNPRVMAGQGTVALELLDEVEALDVLIMPVGGGGLISGCATVCAAVSPRTRVIGVEPEAGDDVAQSMAAGERVRIRVGRTIADGQQTASPGRAHLAHHPGSGLEVVTVTDAQIVDGDALSLRADEARRGAKRRQRLRGAAGRQGCRAGTARRRGAVRRQHRRRRVWQAPRRLTQPSAPARSAGQRRTRSPSGRHRARSRSDWITALLDGSMTTIELDTLHATQM